jgi:hypothetical protein
MKTDRHPTVFVQLISYAAVQIQQAFAKKQPIISIMYMVLQVTVLKLLPD